MTLHISDLLERGAVLVRARSADKRAVLAALSDLAGRNFGLPPSRILAALRQRELSGSTGLGGGVAIPHARIEGLDRVRAVFLKLERPVEFDAVDGLPVDLLFGLFAPPGADPDHLRALAAISRLLRTRGLTARLRGAHASEAILSILTGESRSSAA